MKPYVTTEMLSDWMSNIVFYDMINSIEGSQKKALDIMESHADDRSEDLGVLLEMMNEISAYQSDLGTFKPYLEIKQEVNEQISQHIVFLHRTAGIPFKPLAPDVIGQVVGTAITKTMTQFYDYDAGGYVGTYKDLALAFIEIISEDLFD
jgi:hypothetical protein